MPLRPRQVQVLEGIKKTGTLKNAEPIRRQLGSSKGLNDLVDLGHLRWSGGRLKRTQASLDAFSLLAVVPADGTSIPNEKARQKSGLLGSAYNRAKTLLLESGEIVRGRGQGGSVRRTVALSGASRKGAVGRESELYDSVRIWVESQVPKTPKPSFTLAKAVAHGGGLRRASDLLK